MDDLAILYNDYQGKKIFLHLKSGRKYETSNFQIISNTHATFRDKFNLKVTIQLSEILRIEEVGAKW